MKTKTYRVVLDVTISGDNLKIIRPSIVAKDIAWSCGCLVLYCVSARPIRATEVGKNV